MLYRLRLLLAATLLAAAPAVAQVPFGTASTVQEGLEIGTSTSEIAITSDFRGADLTVFGALTNADELFLAIGQYDVIVTLERPRTTRRCARRIVSSASDCRRSQAVGGATRTPHCPCIHQCQRAEEI